MSGAGVPRRSVDWHRAGTDNAPNPLYLIDPGDACPVCGARLRSYPSDKLQTCMSPHEEPTA